MIRVIVTIVLPLVLPTLMWFGWSVMTQRAAARGGRWQDAPWGWLMGAGIVLAGVILYFASVHFGERGEGRYVPSKFIDGKLVPGRFEH